MQLLTGLIGILLCWGGVCEAAASRSGVPEPVAAVLRGHQVPASSVSIIVHPLDQFEPLLSLNPDVPRNPASTIKLLTTLAALEQLGPHYTWTTEVFTDGQIKGGRLDGDLVFKGYRDPFLVTEAFWQMLRGLRRSGLQHIGGDLIIDNSHFAPTLEDPAAFDRQPLRTYNVQPDALLANFKAVRFFFSSGSGGRDVDIVVDPPLSNLKIDNRLRLIQSPCRGFQRGVSVALAPNGKGDTAIFSGTFPSRCREYSMSRTVLHHDSFVLGLFQSLWSELDGEHDGGVKTGVAPEQAEPIYKHESRSVAEVIRSVNKFSSNVMTRQLLLTLGAEALGAPGTREKGIEAVRAWLANNKVAMPNLVLDNGSGLSRTTRVSAGGLTELLKHAYAGPFRPEFIASLPLAGMDGTLRRRYTREPLRGRLHLKTGRLDDVYAMAGYVLSGSGRWYSVVALQNHPEIHRGPGEELQNALLRWVYRQ